jgi:hypothetical protein
VESKRRSVFFRILGLLVGNGGESAVREIVIGTGPARRRGLFGTLKALKSSFTKINLQTITPRAFSLCLRERHFFLCILRTLFDLLTISGRY